jgi:hypothetical protein
LEQSAVAAAAAALASQEVAEAAVANVEDSVDEATEKANEAAAAALEAAQSALEAAQDALAAAESAAEAANSASTIDPDNFATAAQGDNADTAFGWGNHASAGYAADSAVVKLTGNQTIAGTKTFSSTVAGSINGNAATVTNGVYTTGNQTIEGIKTFSSSPVVPDATTSTQAVNKGQLDAIASQSGITSATAVTASGTSVDFTGIPAWVKRVTVMFSGVSTNGSSLMQIQLGDAGGVETTTYVGVTQVGSTPTAHSSGFLIDAGGPNAAIIRQGSVTLTNISTNTWVAAISTCWSSNTIVVTGSGSKTLSDTLDRIRITTVNGTDTFDAGTINILYEG